MYLPNLLSVQIKWCTFASLYTWTMNIMCTPDHVHINIHETHTYVCTYNYRRNIISIAQIIIIWTVYKWIGVRILFYESSYMWTVKYVQCIFGNLDPNRKDLFANQRHMRHKQNKTT